MFTGIIEDVGSISAIRKLTGRWEFVITTGLDPKGIHEGDSIAVDGVCLTVTSLDGSTFVADASLETLNVTTLKHKSPRQFVNIEQAMGVDGRFGGHMVMGHIDAIGVISRMGSSGDSINLEIEIPRDVAKYIVKKGSVTIDGISLTVNDQRDNRFTLNVIPFSSSRTTLGSKNIGDQVNVETDIVARYIEKFVKPEEPQGMDLDFFYKYGYFKGR
jgi:riboflavin synthase